MQVDQDAVLCLDYLDDVRSHDNETVYLYISYCHDRGGNCGSFSSAYPTGVEIVSKILARIKALVSSTDQQDVDTSTTHKKPEAKMLEIGPIVLAILEGASGAFASHLLTRKKEPIDIRVLVDETAKELKAKNREMEVSLAEIGASLQSLRNLLKHFPEFDVKPDDKVIYKPQKGSDVGIILFRLDEEISSLKLANPVAQSDRSVSPDKQPKQEPATSLPSILEGLEEEIASLRSTPSGSASSDNRSGM